MITADRWLTTVRTKTGPVVRRVGREVRVARARSRGTLPDLAAQRRAAGVDPTPTADGSPTSWWDRETTRLRARQMPLDAVRRPVTGEVAVVCATNRPQYVEDVVANLARQSVIGATHVVLVLNEAGFDVDDVEHRLTAAGCARATVMWVPPEETLGECLTRGVAATDARYVAKFDDDDTYGPRHLEDSIAALQWSGAAVTGKHTYLVHLDETGETAVRFPGHEWSIVGFVAGGTIVIDRERIGDAAFGPTNVGEDTAFLAAVERSGGLILSNTALGYVQQRGTANTWQASARHILDDATSLGRGDLRPSVARG